MLAKKVGIMQPYIFPYIGYFQLIEAVDEFVVFDDVNFISKGWIHRNNLLINGKAFMFNIPLKEASQNKKINEIEILAETVWKSKFLKTLEQAYKKAPFFNESFEVISKIINCNELNLSLFLSQSIISICDFLQINTKIIPSATVFKNEELKAQSRIIDICSKLGATNYMNAIGGMELYDSQIFTQNNIELSFIKTEKIEYSQFKNEFVPNLSIIDILMFNDKDQISNILAKRQFIS